MLESARGMNQNSSRKNIAKQIIPGQDGLYFEPKVPNLLNLSQNMEITS